MEFSHTVVCEDELEAKRQLDQASWMAAWPMGVEMEHLFPRYLAHLLEARKLNLDHERSCGLAGVAGRRAFFSPHQAHQGFVPG